MEVKPFRGAYQAGLLASYDPVLVLEVVEGGLAGPLEIEGPRLVAHPVADEVAVTRVDEYPHVGGEEGRNGVLLRLHPVRRELLIDLHVAARPVGRGRRNAQRGTGGGQVEPLGGGREVVAQTRDLALDADVVGVEP